ncbi:tripartite tricarboxylate transporter TctB family protein [Oricola sp.]|uniref:tripartite tricarboxylate transporter TctB family protein n=1 Tax=Oricola sp. TaxID=1979950 RepID=UPI0025D07CFF|nr:tripartite tricarboxylate transporter TctB family protein [Oricola sp.]MCI5074127.1 tripartite tricarboxylate transporter TctB family protein [Oricola sp.]
MAGIGDHANPGSDDGDVGSRSGRKLAAAFGGILILAFGLLVLVTSFDYRMGTLRQMGPGYVPAILGATLTVLGVLVVVQAVREETRIGLPNMRPFVMISASVLIFALLLERVGLVPTVVATVLVASQSQAGNRLLAAFLLSLVIAALSWLIFSYGLRLPMPAFAWRF